MNVLSLFDGISTCRLALDKAGLKVDKYYSAEIDKYAIQIADKNYPQDKPYRLGDVTKWQNWDIDWSSIGLVTGGFPCFVAGTLVTTDKGLKPIEKVTKDDLVITHKHRFRKVLTPMIKKSNHYNLVKIQGSHELKVTDEHPFYVRKMKKSWDNKARREVRIFDEPNWIECKNLNKGDFVGVPLNQNEIMPIFSDGPNFWYMIGRYVADGYSSTTNKHSRGALSSKNDRRVYKTIITCGKHEENAMDLIIKNVNYTATKTIERTSLKYIISNKDLWNFVQIFGRGAENKEIPPLLLDAPIGIIKSFVDGYLSGDGCYINSKNKKGNKKLYQITTISEKLAYGVIQLIQKAYKVQPSITKSKVDDKKYIEGRLVNQKPSYIVKFHKEKPKFARYYVDNGFLWTPFKEKIRYEKDILVYNFEVEEDNSYAVNNLIVHNCQAWSIAGKQQGDKDERGMLFWTMLDIMKKVLEHNPGAKFLIENVKMKKEFEEYITLHTTQALGTVYKHLINSALVSAQNRQRYYWTNIEGIKQPEDKGILLMDILESREIEKGDKEPKILLENIKPSVAKNILEQEENIREGKNGFYQLKCSSGFQDNKIGITKTPSLRAGNSSAYVKAGDFYYRKLTPLECERLQTLSDNFTEGVSNTQRYKMIGNGFTVSVISHIFSHLPKNVI